MNREQIILVTLLLAIGITTGAFLIYFLRYKRAKVDLDINKEQLERIRKKVTQRDKEIQKCEHELKQYKYIIEALKLYPYCKITKIVSNDIDDLYFVMENYKEGALTYYLSGNKHIGVASNPKIFCKVKSDNIYIEDIFAIDENVGNGSLLLQLVVEKAKELKINIITGELARVDKDNFNKLRRFYEKNGFEVSMNESTNEGKIKMIIQ